MISLPTRPRVLVVATTDSTPETADARFIQALLTAANSS
jgi:hypothetical protein